MKLLAPCGYNAQGRRRVWTLDEEERRQVETNMDAWRRRLQQFDRDVESEPPRIREFYEVRARRVEPVGLIYLWPESN